MNTANKITISRIILVPIFLVFIELKIKYGIYIAAVIFLTAALTDKLDGYIARSRKQVTTFGKFMDPLADKLLVSAALISLTEIQRVPAWISVVIIAREFAVTGLRTIAASDGTIIAASWWGKIKTTIQIIAIAAALINMPFYNILIYAALIITIISGVDYFYKNRSVFRLQK